MSFLGITESGNFGDAHGQFLRGMEFGGALGRGPRLDTPLTSSPLPNLAQARATSLTGAQTIGAQGPAREVAPAAPQTPSPFGDGLMQQVGALFGGNIQITPEIMTQLAQLFGGGGQQPQATPALNQQSTLSLEGPAVQGGGAVPQGTGTAPPNLSAPVTQTQALDVSGRGVGTTASQNAILNPSLAGTYSQVGNVRTLFG